MQLFNTGDVKWRQKAARLQKKKSLLCFASIWLTKSDRRKHKNTIFRLIKISYYMRNVQTGSWPRHLWQVKYFHQYTELIKGVRSWQDDWWPDCFAPPLDLLKKNTTGHAFTKLIGQPQWRKWWVKFITKNYRAQTKHTLGHRTTQEPLVIRVLIAFRLGEKTL